VADRKAARLAGCLHLDTDGRGTGEGAEAVSVVSVSCKRLYRSTGEAGGVKGNRLAGGLIYAPPRLQKGHDRA